MRGIYRLPSMESVRWAFHCGAWAPSREEWLLCAQCVQPEEKRRIGQFVFTRDAKAAMVGRLLMRKLIAEKLHIPWNEISLQRTAKGKPFLSNDITAQYPNFNFNVSHQGDYAVLAAEPERQVGIDVMKTDRPGDLNSLEYARAANKLRSDLVKMDKEKRPVDDFVFYVIGSGSTDEFFRLMNRQFTEKEWSTIKNMRCDWSRLDMFHRHWVHAWDPWAQPSKENLGPVAELQERSDPSRDATLKESFIKAIGVGLGFNLQRIQFGVSRIDMEVGKIYRETKMWLDEEQEDWSFEELLLDNQHHVAVALGEADRLKEKNSKNVKHEDISFTVLTFEDLLTSAVPMALEDPKYWDNFQSKQEVPFRQKSSPS